jgi:thymidylate kinase
MATMGGRGLLIAVYGPSGVGKSKQIELLGEKLKEERVPFKYVVFPIFELGEGGKKLKRVVYQKERPLPEEEMQKLFTENRMEFEPTMRKWLDSGVTVIAEDYVGTGIVWGVTRGMTLERIEEINKDFTPPDVSLLIDGPRRLDLRPGEGHIYQNDEEEWYRARKVYLQMADKYGWIRVGADAPILTVANRIWTVIKLVLTLRK